MSQPRRTVTFATTVAALLLAGASLAGCSSDDPDTTEEGSGQSSFSSAEEYQLAFAECMRDQGVDMPDPGEDGVEIGAGQGEGFMEAAEICSDALGTPPGGEGGARPAQGQREFDLAMAQCLRENGLEVPDPAPDEGLTVPMDAGQDLLAECGAVADEAVGATP
ncbi:hypothetical protein IM660_06630 [Ruania alkalisoli]|uniref:Secreted protein n=1 Tax=Ruania alkalisoli TaxID=2779775 RepID=A0A7M1SWF6_9MICO|nr:hypothetical protein [Ruania alkalisoli]QOR71926.1 hypothetical protein IM660_06630 [Ruania alkalisoli]